MPDLYERSLKVHEQLHGKIEVAGKMPISNRDDLALAAATPDPTRDRVLPDPLDRSIPYQVAAAVALAANNRRA